MRKKLFDLQNFAKKDEEEFEEETAEEEEEGQEQGEELVTEEEKKQFSQAELNKIIDKRLKRAWKKQEKELKKTFGTDNLDEVRQYYEAGKAVSNSAGKSPSEVLQRLGQRTGRSRNVRGQQQPAANPPQAQDDLRKEIQEMKELIQEREEQEAKEQQSTEARKEYGELFDEHYDEIEELAEDKDMSLTDAAAVVLRDRLKDLYQNKEQQKQKKKRRKQVDRTEEGPGSTGSSDDPNEVLTTEQKRTARKMGLSYEKYYNQLKSLGRLD